VQLTDAPFNEPILNHLRSQGTRGHDPAWDLEGWELHVHPDLSERLAQICPRRVALTPVHGVHVLASSGVAAGFVQGTSVLYLRLPVEPTGVAPGRPGGVAGFAAPDWYAVDPWQNDLPSEAGLRKLRQLALTAYQFAGTLA
jgi:hypothetical protein